MDGRAPDDDAVSRALAGDLDAYALIVGRYTAVAHRTALLFGAGDDAEDVVQEAFVKAFAALARFRTGEPLRPWLLRIVVNETRNLHRSRRRRAGLAARLAIVEPAATQEGSPDERPEAQALAHERRRVLWAAVRALPERDRRVVTCRYLLDLSEAETAELLGWPRGSVKSRLSRALVRLQRALPPGTQDREEVAGG